MYDVTAAVGAPKVTFSVGSTHRGMCVVGWEKPTSARRDAETIVPEDFVLTQPHLISSRHNHLYHPTFRSSSFKEIAYHCLLKMNDS